MKLIVLIAAVAASVPIMAMDFDEAVKLCKGTYPGITEPIDDTQNTFGVDERINVAWTRKDGKQNVCSVNTATREVDMASLSGMRLTAPQIRETKATNPPLSGFFTSGV